MLTSTDKIDLIRKGEVGSIRGWCQRQTIDSRWIFRDQVKVEKSEHRSRFYQSLEQYDVINSYVLQQSQVKS